MIKVKQKKRTFAELTTCCQMYSAALISVFRVRRRLDNWPTAGPEQSHPAGQCNPGSQENYSLWATAPPGPLSPEEDDTCEMDTNTAAQPRRRGREGRRRRRTDLKLWFSLISEPLDPITRYCLFFWTSTELQVAFLISSTCVPERTAANSVTEMSRQMKSHVPQHGTNYNSSINSCDITDMKSAH